MLSGSLILMVGYSHASAPSASSFSLSTLACSRERVTRTRLPNNGLSSNQRSVSRSVTTWPIMIIAGDFKPALLTTSTIFSRVPVTTLCSGRVPQRISAIGVWASLPFTTKFSTICGRLPTPIRKTRVPGSCAKRGQLMLLVSLPGSSWPVTTVKLAVKSRWVIGIPA